MEICHLTDIYKIDVANCMTSTKTVNKHEKAKAKWVRNLKESQKWKFCHYRITPMKSRAKFVIPPNIAAFPKQAEKVGICLKSERNNPPQKQHDLALIVLSGLIKVSRSPEIENWIKITLITTLFWLFFFTVASKQKALLHAPSVDGKNTTVCGKYDLNTPTCNLNIVL